MKKEDNQKKRKEMRRRWEAHLILNKIFVSCNHCCLLYSSLSLPAVVAFATPINCWLLTVVYLYLVRCCPLSTPLPSAHTRCPLPTPSASVIAPPMPLPSMVGYCLLSMSILSVSPHSLHHPPPTLIVHHPLHELLSLHLSCHAPPHPPQICLCHCHHPALSLVKDGGKTVLNCCRCQQRSPWHVKLNPDLVWSWVGHFLC